MSSILDGLLQELEQDASDNINTLDIVTVNSLRDIWFLLFFIKITPFLIILN